GEKSCSILGVERIELDRLLTSVGQSDVNAAVLGQVDDVEATKSVLLLLVRQLGVLFNKSLHLILGELLSLADNIDCHCAVGNALLHEILFGTVDTAF